MIDQNQNKRPSTADGLPKWAKNTQKRLQALFQKERFQAFTLPRALRAMGLFAAAYLLAGTPLLFGCYPMGLSLLCAAGSDLFFIWAGCFLSTLTRGEDVALFLTVYSLIFAVKLPLFYRYREKRREGTCFEEPIALRLTLSLSSALIPGLYGSFLEGFSLHAFFALLFYLLSSGALTFLLSGAFKKAPYKTLFSRIGKTTLAVLISYCAGSYSLFGFSAALPLATLFVLLSAQKEHPLFCALSGLFFGLACDRALVLPMAAMGCAAAFLKKAGPRTAPWLSLLAGFALAFYTKGSSALLYTLPDMVCGLLLFLPINGYLKKSAAQVKADPKTEEKDGSFDAFSPAISTLQDKLTSLSEIHRQPDRERAERICQRATEGVCRDCIADCFSSQKRLRSLSDTLFETGRLLPSSPPRGIRPDCTRYEQLCLTVNKDYASYLEALHQKDAACRYAECYESIACLLDDRTKALKERGEEQEEYARRFKRALQKMKIGYAEVSAKGKRAVCFRARDTDLSELSQDASLLRDRLEQECAIALTLPRLCVDEGGRDLFFERRLLFTLSHGHARKKKQGEDYCGDTLLTFFHDGYGYLLLCDGMGSGMDAALSSGIACCFIEQLTYAGASLETAFKTVNDFLLGQSNECPTTVDLLRVDLYDGSAVFIKSGACPSIVLRGGNIFKIASASPPLGATKELHCERIDLNLKAGDRIIMASDGVASDIEGSAWLKELLAGRLKNDPQGLAEDVLALCKQDTPPDDRSVTVIDLLCADEPSKQQN